MNYLDEKAYSKAKSQFQRMTRYNPENPGAWAMLALTQKKMKAARDAKESTEKFHEALKAVPDVEHLPLDQSKLLREVLMRTAEKIEQSGGGVCVPLLSIYHEGTRSLQVRSG